jgi:hypothetical protein
VLLEADPSSLLIKIFAPPVAIILLTCEIPPPDIVNSKNVPISDDDRFGKFQVCPDPPVPSMVTIFPPSATVKFVVAPVAADVTEVLYLNVATSILAATFPYIKKFV